MDDYMEAAEEELKRADHLIFVSLKYTRTVDVLKHVVDRLINALDNMFSALLEYLKENGKIEEIPTTPIQKANYLKELYPDDEMVQEFCDLFMKFRKIAKAKFERSCEFRRHVTMTAFLADDEIVKVDIDTITADFKKTKTFFEHVETLLQVSSDVE
ncbi:hypothetical protein ACFL96_08995 [Thermoproteota archaeon]